MAPGRTPPSPPIDDRSRQVRGGHLRGDERFRRPCPGNRAEMLGRARQGSTGRRPRPDHASANRHQNVSVLAPPPVTTCALPEDSLTASGGSHEADIRDGFDTSGSNRHDRGLRGVRPGDEFTGGPDESRDGRYQFRGRRSGNARRSSRRGPGSAVLHPRVHRWPVRLRSDRRYVGRHPFHSRALVPGTSSGATRRNLEDVVGEVVFFGKGPRARS